MSAPAWEFIRDKVGQLEMVMTADGPFRIERDEIGRMKRVIFEGPGEDRGQVIYDRNIDFEMRSEIKGNTLFGYASVFNQDTLIGGTYYERIAPGAFDNVLADPASDIRALYNHDPAMLLGRQSAGTLRLWTDSTGLGFEVDLPDTTVGRDVRTLAERGDLTGASFHFVPDKTDYALAPDGKQIRTRVTMKRVAEVSVVSFPYYEGTKVQLRAEDQADEDFVLKNKSALIKARHSIHRSMK